jgi:hypothetical protein
MAMIDLSDIQIVSHGTAGVDFILIHSDELSTDTILYLQKEKGYDPDVYDSFNHQVRKIGNKWEHRWNCFDKS